jgi:hypothetical protein
MDFFASVMTVRDLCRRAVNDGVVVEAKHSDASRGVACFYLNCDDEAAHRRTIEFFVEHGLIRKTKAGRFYDISFKLDSQTESGEYGSGFQAEIRLSDFIDLDTGKWLNREG